MATTKQLQNRLGQITTRLQKQTAELAELREKRKALQAELTEAKAKEKSAGGNKKAPARKKAK